MATDKTLLKECVVAAIEIFSEVQKEKGIVFSSEDIVKSSLALYIQYSKAGGSGAGSGDMPGNGKGTGGNLTPATVPQLNFLRKYGKNVTLEGLTKQTASIMIEAIEAVWHKNN